MSKVSDFMEKYGYTYKSFIVAVILIPPASFLIAWKIPNLSRGTRIILTIIAIIVPWLILILGGVGIAKLISFFSG